MYNYYGSLVTVWNCLVGMLWLLYALPSPPLKKAQMQLGYLEDYCKFSPAAPAANPFRYILNP